MPAPKPPSPLNLLSYYSAYPAPQAILPSYPRKLIECTGKFALCAEATCVPIPGSNPPVAECGCYALSGENLGTTSAVLNAAVS